MWLLHAGSLRLHHFHANRDIRYAILSHRWDQNEEVTFQLMSEVGMTDDDESPGNKVVSRIRSPKQGRLQLRAGWRKISNFCHKVRKLGFEYAWIDTCCINKESSAELQESINSMYNWYRGAAICIVYMNDVQLQGNAFPKEQFQRSKWFTRGWTLQELLAPENLIFLDSNWKELGTHEELVDMICNATQISRDAIIGPDRQLYIEGAGIAEKMFWASSRETTQEEDMAYCLIGLFNANMSLRYGEGLRNAFERLQFQILSVGTDETIFVWNHYLRPQERDQVLEPHLGLLAIKPARFRDFDGSLIKPFRPTFRIRPPYNVTNQGIRIQLQLYRYKDLNLTKPLGRIPKSWEDKIWISPLRVASRKAQNQSLFVLSRLKVLKSGTDELEIGLKLMSRI